MTPYLCFLFLTPWSLTALSMPTGLSLAVPWSSVTPRHLHYLLAPTWIPMGLAVAGQAKEAAGQGLRMSPPRSAATSGAWTGQGLGGQQWEMGSNIQGSGKGLG